MKSYGLIHGRLLQLVAELGVEDSFAIGHRGVSPKPGQEFVDLAFAPGAPALLDVLDAILPETRLSEAAFPEWLEQRRPDDFAALLARVGPARAKPLQPALLLNAAERARFLVRTGEEFPLTVVVRSGWPWSDLEESWRTGAPPPERFKLEEGAPGGEGDSGQE